MRNVVDLYDVVQVLKTWTNSWATSLRFHDDKRLPCLLGCDCARDKVEHYVVCGRIHSAVDNMVVKPSDDVSFADFGVARPSEFALRCTACTFYAYHAVKFAPNLWSQVTSGSDQQGQNSRTDGEVITHTATQLNELEAHRIFVGAFRAAAFISGLKCRSTPLCGSGCPDLSSHAQSLLPSTNETIPIHCMDGCLEAASASG